jgi:hypothetical protein
MRRFCLPTVFAMFAGCHTGGVVGVDAPDGPGDDAAPQLGITISWRADPPVPGPLTDKITVSDATFQLDHLQVTADSGSTATTKRSELLWNASQMPRQDAFPSAPVGVYSRVSVAMIGGGLGEHTYEIHGTWTDSGETTPFVIEDNMPLIFGMDCSATLTAGGRLTMRIDLDLKDAVNGINFKALARPGQGVIEIKGGPELMMFRERLKDAFKVEDDSDDDDHD